MIFVGMQRSYDTCLPMDRRPKVLNIFGSLEVILDVLSHD